MLKFAKLVLTKSFYGTGSINLQINEKINVPSESIMGAGEFIQGVQMFRTTTWLKE